MELNQMYKCGGCGSNCAPACCGEAMTFLKASKVKAREYCNKHGLWAAEA